MKENINIVEANINNLTSLWQEAASFYHGCHFSNGYNYCHIKNSDWPNRLWFDEEITETNISAAKNELCTLTNVFTVPYWTVGNHFSNQLFKNAGFEEKTVHVGMSLKLSGHSKRQIRLRVERVVDVTQVKIWAEIYPKAFGIRISEDVLERSHQVIEFYLAFCEEKPVGTAMIYQTGDIIGIHGIGVIPEARRRGFAEEIMAFVLNQAIDRKSAYATLQASAMGKGLYEKLGFKEDFIIQNYILKNSN